MAIEISFNEKREECGVVAIVSKKGDNVAPMLYRALIALQHRGQDAAGFAVLNENKIVEKKGIGLVAEIFKPKDMKLHGSLGIGHTRYPTIGKCRKCDVQPSVYEDIAVAHNGHVANYEQIKKELEGKGYTFSSTVDSEPMAYVLHSEKNLNEAVKNIIEKFEGAFSDVCLYKGKMVIFRDRFSIRPLVWGENDEYVCFASETVALDINGIPYKGEVNGGELIVLENGKMQRTQLVENKPRHCMFEYVYFSRPDSKINGNSVFTVRTRLGEELYKEHPVDADVIVPVPDTSRTAAAAYGKVSGIEVKEGLIKNRYIGRTFIMPDQKKRAEAVGLKLNPVREVLGGKRVVLVDDSIVRGTTLKGIVSLIWNAGAKEVHVRITSPPIMAPCFYGVDIPTYEELIAANKDIEGIMKFVGADSLGYLSIQSLKNAIGVPICTGCLDKGYHTEFIRKLAESKQRK